MLLGKLRVVVAAALGAVALADLPSAASLASVPAEAAPLTPVPAAITAIANEAGVESRFPGLRMEDLLRTYADVGNPRTYLDVVRALVEYRRGVRLPDLRQAESVTVATDSEEARTEEALATGDGAGVDETQSGDAPVAVYASPAGDFTGDRLADALLIEVPLTPAPMRLTATAGTTGGLVWRRALGGAPYDAAAVPAGDLNADGRDDLLVVRLDLHSLTTDGSCDQTSNCHVERRSSFTWAVEGWSGADGATLWKRSYPGTVRDRIDSTTTETSSSFEEQYESTNAFLLPFLSGDHDRSGGPDVVVNVIDLKFTEKRTTRKTSVATEERTGSYNQRAGTRAAVVGGASNLDLFTRTASSVPAISVLQPAGQAVGTGVPDLLWAASNVADSQYSCIGLPAGQACTDEPERTPLTLELEMVDGATFATTWRSSSGALADGFTAVLRADVTNDGKADLMTFELKRDPALGLQASEVLLSGGTGGVAWRRTEAGEWATPIAFGPLGGQPGDDLLFAFFTEPGSSFGSLPGGTPPPGITAHLARVDGVNGSLLLETARTYTFDPGSATHDGIYAYGAGQTDTDGDGAPDAVTGAIGFASSAGVSTSVSESIAESGRTGSSTHAFRRAGTSLLTPLRDLDGDRLGDALDMTLRPGGRVDLTAIRMKPAATLWQSALQGRFTFLAQAGDQDGLPGQELLRTEIDLTPSSVSSRIASLSGRTGAARWSLLL